MEESRLAEGGGRDGAAVDHGVGAGDGAQPDQDPEIGLEGGDTGATVVPLFSVPDSLRSVDVAVGGRAVRGLLLIAVVLLLTLGGRWWWVNQQAVGVPVEQVVDVGATASAEEESAEVGQGGPGEEASEGVEDTSGAEGINATSGAEGISPTSGAEGRAAHAVLVVHVIGQVHEPGVVELPPGSRVIDAVRAAGGVTDEADPASLNLAWPVVDGEQVWVGAPGEEPPAGLHAGAPGAGSGGALSGGAPGGPAGDQTGAGGGQGGLLVDLNLASQGELEELPGIGPVTAGNILAWREQHGRFTAVEELMEVSGIGEKTFEQLRPHVTIGG